MATNRKIRNLAGSAALAVLVLLLLFAGRPESITGPVPDPGVTPAEPSPPPVVPVAETRATDPKSPAPDPTAVAAQPEAPRRVPLEVEVIDGDTGEPLRDAALKLEMRDDRVLVLRRVGDVFVHPDATYEVRSTATVWLHVRTPRGYRLARPGRLLHQGAVTQYTKRLRLTIPAWREADVMVRVVDHAGWPVAGAEITAARFLGVDRKTGARPTDENGWTELTGIPALRGETLVVRARTEERRNGAIVTVEGAWSAVRAVITLPEEKGDGRVGLANGAGGFGGRSDRFLRRKKGDEKISVRVRHRDGRPAADATVVVSGASTFVHGRTDADGRVELKGLIPGELTVSVNEPGFVMGTPVPVTVVAGKTATAEVVEAPERWITGLVLDEEGRPLPSADVLMRMRKHNRFVCLDEDGLQRLNLLTDPDGRFVFPNAPPRELRVVVEYGSRKAEAMSAGAGATTVKFQRKRPGSR